MGIVCVSNHQDVQEHLPAPSVWPSVLGAGVAIAAFGVATSYAVCALGGVLVALGLGGWISDLRHAHD